MTQIEPTPCLPPGVGIQLPAVYIPQLNEILAAFAQNQELLVALQDAIANLSATISDEHREFLDAIAANTAATAAAVQAASDAVARADLAESEKAEIQTQLDAALAANAEAEAAVEALIPAVEGISEPDSPPVEPPVEEPPA
jgi:hypothetical protein